MRVLFPMQFCRAAGCVDSYRDFPSTTVAILHDILEAANGQPDLLSAHVHPCAATRRHVPVPKSVLNSVEIPAVCMQVHRCTLIMGEPANETQRTLWIGDLGYWMDENFLYNLFAGTGTVTSVKIIRSKATNVSEGYGFIEFNSHDAASQVLHLLLCMFCTNHSAVVFMHQKLDTFFPALLSRNIIFRQNTFTVNVTLEQVCKKEIHKSHG
jgi:hypothetical protein